MPVHLYGQMADMPALMQIAKRYGMRVIEDAAQAIGARETSSRPNRAGKDWIAGAVGDLGCFSFYPTKNLGGVGEGGMVITGDAALAEKIRILRNHGMNPRYHHRMIGINSRLDALQAAVLRIKLRRLKRWTERAPGKCGAIPRPVCGNGIAPSPGDSPGGKEGGLSYL